MHIHHLSDLPPEVVSPCQLPCDNHNDSRALQSIPGAFSNTDLISPPIPKGCEDGDSWKTLLAGLDEFLEGPEVLERKDVIIGLFSDIGKMTESDKDRLLGCADLLGKFGTHFARSVPHNTWYALKLLIVHRTKAYRIVGTFEAYAHKKGMSKQTAYHRIHLAELTLAIWASAPLLPIPEGVERVKAIHRLPLEHWVPFWNSLLLSGCGIEPTPGAVLKAVKVYALEHGIDIGSSSKSSGTDERESSPGGQGLEAFDALIPDNLREKFSAMLPDSSPTRWTLEILLSQMAVPTHLQETAKQTAEKIRQSNPQDWNALMDFLTAVLLRSVERSLR